MSGNILASVDYVDNLCIGQDIGRFWFDYISRSEDSRKSQ